MLQKNIQAKQLNGAALAYIGDGVYELFVRGKVLEEGYSQPNRLHKLSVRYVEASAQAKVMRHWLDLEDYLSEEEISIFKRGRNHKVNTKAKSASLADYRMATGFEALIGYLYLNQEEERLEELLNDAVEFIDQNKGG